MPAKLFAPVVASRTPAMLSLPTLLLTSCVVHVPTVELTAAVSCDSSGYRGGGASASGLAGCVHLFAWRLRAMDENRIDVRTLVVIRRDAVKCR